MTVLIAQNTKNKIILAADSGLFQGDRKTHATNHKNWLKIRQINDITFSACGHLNDIINFELFCSSRKPESDSVLSMQRFFIEFIKWLKENGLLQEGEVLDSNFFICYNKKLFHYMDSSVYEILENEFQTDGAGKFEAYMAMYLGKTPTESIELKNKMNVWTSGDVQIVEIKKRTR